MQWTCDAPRTLEQCGPTLRESRTFATPQAAVARTWSRRYRYGIAIIGWTPPVIAYNLDLFRTRSPLPNS